MLCKVKGSRNWYSRFTAPNGARVLRSTKTRDKKDAEEFEQKLKQKYWRAGVLGEVDKTWEDAVVTYCLGREVDSWHLTILDKYCRGKRLTELSDVRDSVVSDRLADGVVNSTVNRTLEVFRAIVNKAVQRSWMAPLYVEMLDEPEGRVRWITHQEAGCLLSELPMHLREMVRFALATGLRESNITGLEWKRVDLHRRLVWVESDDVKNDEAHQVPLSQTAVDILLRQQGKHRHNVFTYRGRTVKKMNTKAYGKALERARIQDFTVHDLRHTWASWHVQSGTTLQVLQKLGGWKTLAMVMKYAHLAPSHVAEHADNIRYFGKVLAVDDLVSVAKVA